MPEGARESLQQFLLRKLRLAARAREGRRSSRELRVQEVGAEVVVQQVAVEKLERPEQAGQANHGRQVTTLHGIKLRRQFLAAFVVEARRFVTEMRLGLH